MRIDFDFNSATAQALRSHNQYLEAIQGPLDRLREFDFVTKAVEQHHGFRKYLGVQWDSMNNYGAISDVLKSHNLLMESFSGSIGSNEANRYKNTISLMQSDIFDKFNTFNRLGITANSINTSLTGLSTLTRIQESLAVFKETSAIENALKSIKDFSSINSTYESLINKHHEIFDRINPNVTSWLSKSFLELKNIQELNTGIEINSDGTVTGFGSSITIDDIHDFISNKINKLASIVEDKSIEQKIFDYFEPFGNRHPIIKYILLTILFQMVIGVFINNITDSSDKIIKYINQQNTVLLKELKREIKNQNLPPQALSSFRVVSTRQLTVKSSNSRDSKTVETLCRGQVVEIVQKKRHWTLVEYRRDNEDTCIHGWVYTRYLGQLK